MRLPDCVFCDVSKIEGPVTRHNLKGRTFFVFEPLNPVTEGHVLVIPKAHFSDACDYPEVTGIGANLAAQVARLHDAANIITSIGAAATQSVKHLHWHVVPRTEGDGLHLPWTGQSNA